MRPHIPASWCYKDDDEEEEDNDDDDDDDDDDITEVLKQRMLNKS